MPTRPTSRTNTPRSRALLPGGCGALLLLLMTAMPASAQVTWRVSLDSSGSEVDGSSQYVAISEDGRFVGFDSWATDLVSGDHNGFNDVFVRDRRTGTTTRVSVHSSGTEADAASYHTSISRNGEKVAFQSWATNLVAGDTNAVPDIFVHDRTTGTTTRVSVDSAGIQANGRSDFLSISGDGDAVAFESWAWNLVSGDTLTYKDIFVHDLGTGVTTRVSVNSAGDEADDDSVRPSLSSDGRFVAFESLATNLVPLDGNAASDIFVHDRVTGLTTRASVSSSGVEGNAASSYPSISADGRFVAFYSTASNLVPSDTNGAADVFVHDRTAGTTIRVSVGSSGSQANSSSYLPSISGDGGRVAFSSYASDLVTGDTNAAEDVFIHDLGTGVTTRESVSTADEEADRWSLYPAMSLDGRFVAFHSAATDLVSGDNNFRNDAFVRGPELILEAPPEVTAGDSLDFTTWRGTATGRAMLFAVAVNGSPFVFRIAVGRFDAQGIWTKNYTVPNDPTLVGLDITFESAGIGAVFGKALTSNLEVVEFR